jgi:hypothetical protein
MAEHVGDLGSDFDGRVRSSLAVMAPPASSDGVLEGVRRRVARRKRRFHEAIGAALVVLLGGGALTGIALTSGPPVAVAPPAHTTTANSTIPTSTPPSAASSTGSAAHSSASAPDYAGSTNRSLDPALSNTAPCPTHQALPSMSTGRFCGPAPGPGNGLGPGGECTGNEIIPPCGSGVVPGRFYAFTDPGTCRGLVTFDGRQWVSELLPPNPVPPFDVWIQLGANGSVRWIAPTGSVGLQPYTGQTLGTCQ